MDPNLSKAELLDRFKEDDSELLDDFSQIEESQLLQSPRFKRLQSSSPPRSNSSSPTKSGGSNENNSSLDVIPKLEYRKSNPLLRTPTKPKPSKIPLQPLNRRSSQSRFLPLSPSKSTHNKKLPEMRVSLTPAQRMEKKPGRLLNTNDILAQYEFKETIGKGAFANVYRAFNRQTGTDVAVKEIVIEDDDNILELMSEIDLLKVLKHKNIVKYHGFLRNEKKLFIFLEYCSGGSLRNMYKSSGPLKEEQVAKYMVSVLEGVIYLHDQGVVHRDIKAANILLTSKGDIKLTDFGVSTKETSKTIKTYSIAGTPNWMAPEIISMDGTTTASDIWSLGATIVELIAGEPLYSHLNEMAALHAIVTDKHPPIPQFISPLCRDFLMKCFEKQPKNRITAKELLQHEWLKTGVLGTPRKHPAVDSVVLQHKRVQSKNSIIENDFNSIKRHNTKKFLPMDVNTFKHSDTDLHEFIENELVDEFGELNIKKQTRYSTNVFDPMTIKHSTTEWDQVKRSLILDPYDEDVVADAVTHFKSTRDDIEASFDVMMVSNMIQWLEGSETNEVAPQLELLETLMSRSVIITSWFVELGGLTTLTDLLGNEIPLNVRQNATKALLSAFESDATHLSTFVQSGCFKRCLRLLEEDCQVHPELVVFIIDVIYKSYQEAVVSISVLQLITLGYPNFLDWIAVLLLHFVNNDDLPSVNKIVSIICFTKGSPLLNPKPIFLNSVYKVHEKLNRTQQIKLLRFLKSFNTGELPESANLIKFLVKTMKRVANSKQFDNELLNLTCALIFNVCHLNLERQVDLIKNDSLPTFQKLMNSTLPCTEFIIPLLCGFASNEKLAAKIMKSETAIVENYTELLIDPVWQSNAMDALVSLHELIGGDKIPRLLLVGDCQFLVRGLLLKDTLNYELFLGRLNRFLSLYSTSMSINRIRLTLFNSDEVFSAIRQRIEKTKSDLVIQVDLFKLLKTLSTNNFTYANYQKLVDFVKTVKKTGVLLIDQMVSEIVTAQSNKENNLMAPPVFGIPDIISHTST
ncbi:CYFA0S18e00430g1_1 [Cyberlindnera fabianii]|uniref:non-specific serine/threonine protein kinase n=1 Tax=Cyberlindnera fabianii TaxID=36022 RepID=A0A061B7L2_CYBFA|nr:CYFA0S18e00430g1_1 [Cyberlindnera fabianii]